MRASLLSLMLLASAAVPALAQTGPLQTGPLQTGPLQPGPLQPAPVPAIGAPTVLPSQRVPGAGPQADSAGPLNATPFSGRPTRTPTFGDQADPHSAANAKGGPVTAPHVSR